MGWTHLALGESRKSFLKKWHLSYNAKDERELERKSEEETEVFRVDRPHKGLEAGKNPPSSSNDVLENINYSFSIKRSMCVSIHAIYYQWYWYLR